ncbi:MAG: hypothetical protein HUJ78_05800, partial [Mogibacterium sp.]|nr:hypothetical protein [Mogibacterium sp.]
VIKKDVNKGWPLSHFYISNLATVVIAVIVILILLLAFRIINVRRRRAKRKAQKRKEMIRREALRQLAEEEDRIRRGWTYTSDFEKRKTLK